jgi:hypothetical protein
MAEESEERYQMGLKEKGRSRRTVEREREEGEGESGVERFLGVEVWHDNKRGRAGFWTHLCMRNYWGFTCTYWERERPSEREENEKYNLVNRIQLSIQLE